MAWLRCEHTIRRTGHDYVLRKVLTTIGRAPGNDLVLEDPMLQQTHAQLMRQGSQFAISVVGNAGEIYVNGRRVKTATLAEGDKILLGVWQLTYSAGEPRTTSEPDPAGTLGIDALEQLVALSGEMMRDTTPNRLFGTLLKGLVALTRAEKGFVLVFQDGERHLA